MEEEDEEEEADEEDEDEEDEDEEEEEEDGRAESGEEAPPRGVRFTQRKQRQAILLAVIARL